ncbi:hypothetical protein V9T40_012185 [Parthenolecanium corni]|uniref:PI3K/PI4K catalytic domain-containing protein n=1 Tax=Parthenolecanium corni TaxID=536013 RepID=A0AAN9XZ80_9HEMI
MDASGSVRSQLKILHDCLLTEANFSKDLITPALQSLSNFVGEVTDVDNAKLLFESIVLGLINFIKELRKKTSVENEIVSTTFLLLDNILFDFDGICQLYFEPVYDLLSTCTFWAHVLEIRLHSFLLVRKLVEHESSLSVPEILDKGITELEGILECMNSFLFHFFDNMNEDTSNSLYLSIKKICEEAKSRRTAAREALKLLGHHFELFSRKIMENYSWWHFVIRDYLRSPNKDDYIIAFEISDLYYRKVAELLSNVPCQISDSGAVLDFFTSELKKYLLSSEKRETSVALKNIGCFAPACKLHGKLAVIRDLFREMAEIVEKFSLGFEEDFDVQLLADMLISLTNIVKHLEGQFADEEESGLDVLIKLGRYVIISYPKVPFRFQINVKRALVRSFIQIACINEYFLETFLDQIVFVCLIQTCSHLTEDDVILLKELGASDKEMTSSKNFVPLWRDLCNLRNVSYLETIPGEYMVLTKTNLQEFQIYPPINSDNLPEIELKNESDYIILNNLIELFSVVVESCEFEMLNPSIPSLMKTFVEYARVNPIKGGFFHLLTTVFKKSGSSFCIEEHPDVHRLLHSFFLDILVRVDEFHGPELITCLRMMINAPMSIVKTVILSRLSVLFKAVFDIGREDIFLALDGLKSLEKVYSKIPLDDFEVVLLSVVPHLRYYLETSHFVGETDSLTKHEEDLVASALTKSKDNTLKKYYKYISSANIDLSTLQEEIVKFLSTVDAKYCISLYTPRICTFTESYNYLKFDIPFGDMKVNVFLDKFLPRTIEIACNSSDLKTRIVACEFLHSVITIFVANSNFTLTYPKEIRQLFSDLVTCSMKLGCDINSVVKQMFLPLCKQITRYYASRPLTDSPGTKILLNILFNGISDKTDNALRHLCAKLIRIFVQWSLKKTKIDIRRHRVPVNVEAVIQKMCFFCVLPCSYNKLGAALAFINLYDVFQGDFNVLNVFWVEIVVAFVKNLFSSAERDCNNELTRKALGFMGRILRENSEILMKENDRRRIPQPLSSSEIPELVNTLFHYSVSRNKHCRCACMNLISDLSRAAGHESLESFLKNSQSTINMVLEYNFECLRVDPDVAMFEVETTVEKLEKLRTYLQTSLSGLHCLEWSLREKIIDFDTFINIDSRDFMYVMYEQWFVPEPLIEQNVALESYLFDFIQQTSKRYKSCFKFSSECHLNVRQWLVQRLAHPNSLVLKKERIIRLLPPFVMQHEDASISEMFHELKKQYLDLTGQCILSETEFILLFTALLTLLRESQNAAVLQLVISFRAFDSKGVCDEGIEESLRALLRPQFSNYQLHVVNVVYNIIRNNSGDFSVDFVVDIVNLFLIPLLRISNSDTVINFYSAEFHFLLESLKSTEQNYTTSEKEKTEIIRQICAVRLIEAYCDCVRNLDCPVVTMALYPNGENMLRKELIKVLRSVIQKKTTLQDATNNAIFRQMKCFSYNTLIKIIKKIQTEEKFYNLLFIESHRPGDKIWKHLVDCREIKLSMVPEEISTRRKNFKQKKVKKKGNAVHSLPSQYLSTSSLVEDIVKYDFSGWTQTDSAFENAHSSDITDLEEEILNQHECMVPLCDLLKFLVETKISPAPNLETDMNPQMRPWMEYLYASLDSYLKEKNKNVIMFLIRLVYNCEDIFIPYASNWIDLIVKCLIFLDDVNYFTSDIITMLTFTWRNRSAPKTELANSLFKLLLRKIDGNPTIRNYQLDLIGAVIDSWHAVLDANFTFLQPQLKVETVKEINLKIAKRFLLHAVFPFGRENKTETAQSDSTIVNATESAELKEKLATCLTWLISSNATRTDLFYSCLDHVVLYYPQIVDKFASYLLNNFKKLQGIFKIKCLKILSNTSEHLDDVFALLIRPELVTCLQTNEYDLQIQALAVLSVAVPKFKDADVNQFLPVLAKLSSHPSAKCRRATYDILNSILLNYNDKTGNDCEEIKLHCKTILLNGLLDRDSSLQQEMFNSWKSRLNLNEEVSNRFMKIISEMYSPSNESQFVSYAVDFLLDASSLVSDYESNIFDSPLLSTDEFQEYHILRGGSCTRSILPEFPSSISHRMKMLTQQSNFSSLSLRLHSSQSDFIFKPSLSSGHSLPKRADSTNLNAEHSAPSASSEIQLEKDKLRRRLFKNQGEATEHFASMQVRRKERRKALIAQKYEKVNQKITFCRKYRDGEFPDIQIPRSAVIVPLQMLAKRDITFAKIVLVNILEEILSKIPDKKEYLRRVNEIFNEMLKSSYKHDRVFVETLMEIAFFHVNDISLDSNIIATASHSSGLYSLGTLLLENSIQKINVCSEEHVSKKLKTDRNLNDSWTQLAELYSALNESDVVNGILQEKVSSNTSSVMKEGLAHEQAGNMSEAMNTYKKGLGTFVQQTMKSYDEHFITEAFFKCANYLSMFEEINDYVLEQFEDFNTLWNDNWDIEHTLPWFFTSEAYLRVEDDRKYGLLDSVLGAWLEDKNKGPLLTNLVAEQLAVLFACVNQSGKASVIVKDCLKFLINDWSCSKTSLNHFHRLQILSEIHTMLEILNDSSNEVDVKISGLLKTWERCVPAKNAINFWDRRIMNRKLFVQKFSTELPIDDELREQLNDSKIHLKFLVLESAIDQGNYHVANKYLMSLNNDEEEPSIPDKFVNRFWLDLSKIWLLKKKNGADVEDFFLCLDYLGPQSLIYEENLTRSLLKALKFGSKESQILFPTLLHLSHITSDSVKEVFLSESDQIEEWKYLPWVQQLLTYVSTDFVSLIENILKKIMDRYPNSLQLTFYSTVKNFNNTSLKTQSLIDELQKKVDPHGKVLKLIEAFSHIRSPDSFFDHWWTQLWKTTKQSNMLGELIAVEEQLRQAIAPRGELFTANRFLRLFTECIGKVKNNPDNRNLIDTTLRNLKVAISESQNAQQSDTHELLELYSPTCAQFTDWCGECIEIPGQYDGFSVPVPEKHAKMHSFHKRVKVQMSKQKPIKVKIIGNDAKKYAYLVKFEDDMRQDQRIQQIFSLINQCASSDDTNSKNLSVITYGVHPLETDFGIIEWVENTTTLKEFLDYGLSNDEKTYWNALLALGNSPSIFWNLRNTFMRAYSTMCIYGWMLGIGDRHLKNTLVCLKTGNCIGIDFGYAFGAGVEYTRIPELIPFRMTPHIKSIMAPMYLTGLIRETMIATLKKFRKNEQILVAALQIFILEPAFNYYWFSLVKKRLEQSENMEELRCYPAQKIDTIRSKLMGTNPTVILIDEIRKNQVINSQYKSALIKLVAEKNRSVEDNLPVSAQVDQLLDLATDEGILGVSWCGLETYI